MNLFFRLDCICKLFKQKQGDVLLIDLLRLAFGRYVEPPNDQDFDSWDLETPVVILSGGEYQDGDLCAQHWFEGVYLPYEPFDFRFFVGSDST